MSVSDQEVFYQIAQEIISELGPALSTRPYIAIVDFHGEFKYIESELHQYSDFIINFIKHNFRLLQIGDHSMPISGTNLAFFKVSKKAIIIIYIKKGLIGQLLFFKNRMVKYQSKLDELIVGEPLDITVPVAEYKQEPEVVEQVPPPAPEEPTAKVIPVLLKKIGKKAKFPLQEVVILNYCDGMNSTKEIMGEGNISKIALWTILDKYKKKGWIKITYTGNPIFIPVLTKEIPPMAVQLGVVNKKEYEISKYCNGDNTIADIQEALGMDRMEIEEIIDKMENNNIIHLEVQ